jgi:uncharacterized damage-inducible protein DinB
MVEQLIETWRINNRVTLKVLEALPVGALGATLSARGGRDVARQFAHLHDVRLGWLPKRDVSDAITRFAKGESPDKAKLAQAFGESAQAVERTIVHACGHNGQVAGYKRGIVVLIGYLIAHEAHHRGSILLTAKHTGHRLPDELRWGIWAWDKI